MTTDTRTTAAPLPESEAQPDEEENEIGPDPEEAVGGPIRESEGLWHFKRSDRL